jgi:hypothetical protein
LRGNGPPSAFAAALVATGAAPLPNRAALVASVAGPSGAAAHYTARLQTVVADELMARVAAGEPVSGVRAETVDLFRAAAAGSASGKPLSDVRAARLLAGLVDIGARDVVLSWAGEKDTDGLLALLLALAGRATEPLNVPVLTVLAWVAYARGDGGLANVAIEGALSTDPGYTMARLVASGLESGLHPRHVLAVSREISRTEPDFPELTG